ncbi:hypothetical protein AB5N19_09606 [Seiridium cardinale]
MDPITALSVASAAVTFFEFVFELLKDTIEIQAEGQTLTAQSFELSTNELASYTRVLKRRPLIDDGPEGPLAEYERALNALLDECSVTAQQLLDLLNSLKAKANRAKWYSFLQAINTVWKRDELDQLNNRLGVYRTDLSIRILGYLNAKTDVYAAQNRQALSDVHKSGREIVQILSINHADMIDRLSKQETRLAHQLEAQSSSRRKSGLIDAVLTFKDGDTKSLSSGILGRGTDLQRLEDPRDFRLGKIMTTRAGTPAEDASSYFVDFDRIQRRILNCLHFRYIRDRVESIGLAHKTTFEWIYHPPSYYNVLWSDFPKWLKQDAGCYWINGKAASGKSTLMRFISSDPRLMEHLHAWAGELPLVTASFFFWFLGTPLQKSQVGLLRSLLFDILSQRPELIPQVMPELCREAEKSGHLVQEAFAEPTMTEVTLWFKRLKAATKRQYRICLTIDGLDEFDGDHQVLLDFLEEICYNTSSIKLLVSSRPITACTHALGHFPSLRLQDLTQSDIRQYVEDRMLYQRYRDPGWVEVMEKIVEKSSGVFLWVRLVVNSLLQGLRDGDTVSELQSRLDELPSDIKDLYQHMVQRIPPEYRTQAAELIRLVLLNLQSQDGGPFFSPLTTLHISFSLETWDSVLKCPNKPISDQEIKSRHHSIEARVSSRCLGLIELQRRTGSYLPSCDDNVGFIHKTAFEFLEGKSMSSKLEALTGSTDFNPYASLFWSCILLSKTDRPTKTIDYRVLGGRTWSHLKPAFCLANLAEARGCPLDSKYLVEYDDALQRSWESARFWHDNNLVNVQNNKITGHWSNVLISAAMLQPSSRRVCRVPETLSFGQPSGPPRPVAKLANDAVPGAIMHQGISRAIRKSSNNKGLALVCVLFSLPSMLRIILQNVPLRVGGDQQITKNDAADLLECLIYKNVLLEFLGSNFIICPQSC